MNIPKNTARIRKVLTLDEFFAGHAELRPLFEVLLSLVNQIGSAEFTITKSQIAFRRGKAFAWVWIPAKYLRGKIAPLVLSLCFPNRDLSPRWKEIVEPARGQFMHHLEIYSVEDIDSQVNEWLRVAWQQAG